MLFQNKINLRYCASGWFYYRGLQQSIERGSIFCRTRAIFFFTTVSTRALGAHPSWTTELYPPRNERGRNTKLTTHIRLAPASGMSKAENWQPTRLHEVHKENCLLSLLFLSCCKFRLLNSIFQTVVPAKSCVKLTNY